MSIQKYQVREKTLLVLMLLSSFTFGCVYSQNYVASIPDVQGAGLSLVEKSVQQKKNHIMELKGLQLSVKPFNARLISRINSWFLFIPIPFDKVYSRAERFGRNDRTANPPFFIEVAFHPVEGGLNMDPSQTVLHLGGQDYGPMQMVIPSDLLPMSSFGGGGYQGPDLCSWPGRIRLEEMLRPLQQVLIPKDGKTCVWLSFDVAPPLPETEFSVSIKGIEMAGKLVDIPTLRFVKGKAHLFDKIP